MAFPKHRKLALERGLTLAEVTVGFFVFGLLMVVLVMSLRRSTAVWERASGSSTSQQEMRKAYAALLQDFQRTEHDVVQAASGPVSLSGRDGDAVWFLSPVASSGPPALRTSDGRPFWQRNILYYSVVPNNHAALYGSTCTGGADAQGYESRCPHKMLIRKIIDVSPATDASDETKPETLITNIAPYLTRPNGYSTSGMTEPGVESVEIKAQSLLSFRVQKGTNPQWPGEILFDLRSVRLDEARRSANIGVDSLDTWTQQFTFSAFPPASLQE